MQAVFEHEQFCPLRFDEPRDRNAGPRADHLGDLIGADVPAEQPLCHSFACLPRVPLHALLLQPLQQSPPLHVELVEPLVDLLADRLACRLPLLDRHAGLVKRVLHLV